MKALSHLDNALAQSRADIEAGRYVIESAEAHSARLAAMLMQEHLSSRAATGVMVKSSSKKKTVPRRASR